MDHLLILIINVVALCSVTRRAIKLWPQVVQAIRRHRQIKAQEKFWAKEIERCRSHFCTSLCLKDWERSVEWCLRLQMARHRMNVEVNAPLRRPLIKVRRKTEFTGPS